MEPNYLVTLAYLITIPGVAIYSLTEASEGNAFPLPVASTPPDTESQ